MRKLLLILLFISPLLVFSQDAESEAIMEQLGYQKVDTKALEKEQNAAAKSCSSCPFKQKPNNQSNVTINTIEEIAKLKQQLPPLEQAILDEKNNPSPSQEKLAKYQTALTNTQEQIEKLEQQTAKKEVAPN